MADFKEKVFETVDRAEHALRALDLADRLAMRPQFGSTGAGNPIESVLAELVKEGRLYWYGREPDRVYYTNPMQLR